MRRTRASLTAIAAAAAVVLAACGTADTNGGGTSGGGAAGSEEAARNGTADGAARGGTLNILGAGDVDYLDPQVTYYSAGYTVARLYSRQLFAYPADPAKKDTAAPDLAEQLPTTDNGGISADGKTYTITIKQGAQWNTTPPRQVTAADEVIGVKRTCNPAQPFGGLPDFQDLIVGFKAVLRRVRRRSARTPRRSRSTSQATPLPGVVAKDDRTVVFTLNSARHVLHRHAGAPRAVARPGRVPRLRAGQHRTRPAPDRERAVQDRQVRPDEADRAVPQPGVERGDRPDPRRVRRQDRHRRDAEPGVDPAAAADRHAQRRHACSTSARPPSQIPGLLAANDPNLALVPDERVSNPYLVYNTRSPNNNKALANVKVRQAISYAINRANIIQVNGGPQVAPPLTHVLPPRILGSQDNDPYPYDPDKAKQMLAEAGYPERPDAEVPLPQRLRGQQQDVRHRAAGPHEGGHHGRGRAVAERRLLHQVPAGARRRAARRVGHREPELGRGLGAATPPLSYFNPLLLGCAVVPAERQQLRLLRQPRDQRPDQAGPRRDRRAVGGRRLGQGRQAGDGGRGVLPGHQPEVADLPRRPGAQRGLPRRAAVASTRPTCGSTRPRTAADGGFMDVLEVEDLHVSFNTPDGVVRAVRGVSFSVERGRTLGIVGESGSGKSVATQTIVGLTRGARVSGRATLDGVDLLGASPEALRRIRGAQIGMIFQDPLSSLHPYYKVGWQIVEMIREHERGMSKAAARERAIELLDAVGIPSPRTPDRQLPARVLRRHAATRDDRDGDGAAARGAGRRRAAPRRWTSRCRPRCST